MPQRTVNIILTSLVIIAFVGCTGDSAASKGDSLNEMSIKRSLLQKLPPTNALPLKTERSFTPDNNDILLFPISLTASDDGQVYVSDNNGHAIYRVSSDLETITQITKEETEIDEEKLKYPNTVRFHDGKIFIADNDGIKVFKQNGELENVIRCFYSINDFLVDSKGNFLLNAIFLKANPENSLVIKLNKNGARVKGIGQRPNPSENNNLEGKAYVETGEQIIIVAYKHFPLVQVYDIDSGDFIREFEIRRPIFDELTKLKENKEFVNPKKGMVVLPRYFAGVKILKDRIFLLFHLPNIEIIEVDFEGKELNHYRSDSITVENYFGFDLRSVGNARQFIVGVIGPSRIPTIAVLNQNTENQYQKTGGK